MYRKKYKRTKLYYIIIICVHIINFFDNNKINNKVFETYTYNIGNLYQKYKFASKKREIIIEKCLVFYITIWQIINFSTTLSIQNI